MKVDVNGEFREALLRLKKRLAEPGDRPVTHSKLTSGRLDAALRRLETERFGVCARCFKVIPRAELLMRPYIEFCPTCDPR